MSVHLVTCAAAVNIKPSEKLVLLCLAENANSRDSRAFPGMTGLMAWSGLSRARVFEILKRLQEYRLIEQVGAGHRGRAAEFLVFPDGCCPAHRASEGSDTPDPIDPCGKSDTSDPFEEKGSTFDPERVQETTPKGPAHQTPTNYPPLTPTSLSPEVRETEPFGQAIPVRGWHDEDCEHGIDRHSSCMQCAKSKQAQKVASA